MLDLKSFSQAIQQIADEKGIAKEKIIETIELALAAAYKRDYGKKGQIVHAKLDPVTGRASMKQIKIVVDETMIKSEEEVKAEEEERMRKLATAAEGKVPEEKSSFTKATEDKRKEDLSSEASAEEEKKVRFNPEKHILLEEAVKIKPDAKPGDELEFELEYHEEFGRIAAQTAKQVIMQRIREIEREAVFGEYKAKEGELVSGLVQRIEGRNVFVDIGRAVGLLPQEEQIPYERYQPGLRLKALILLVEKDPKGTGVFLSRSHPRFLRKLFELEVPEITAGTVEIKAIAREAGSRSKVAATSHENGVDPVGSLVGQKGIRVSTVINEMGGEKIDVIQWSEKPAEFVAHSLSPAKVLEVEINEKFREARAIVPEEQLSLAIGKGGQNVRLAAKLTGWKIDVRSKQQMKGVSSEEVAEEAVTKVDIGENVREELKDLAQEVVKAEEPSAEDGKEKPTEEVPHSSLAAQNAEKELTTKNEGEKKPKKKRAKKAKEDKPEEKPQTEN